MFTIINPYELQSLPVGLIVLNPPSSRVGSSDATIWQAGGAIPNQTLFSKPFNMPGMVVLAQGQNPNFTLRTSSDGGLTWTQRYADLFAHQVTGDYSPTLGRAVLGGNGADGTLWSDDGITWTRVATVFDNSEIGIFWIPAFNYFVVAPGLNNAGQTNWYTSNDGKVWGATGAIGNGVQFRYQKAIFAQDRIIGMPGAFGAYQHSRHSVDGKLYVEGGLLPAAGAWNICAYSKQLRRIVAGINNTATGAYSDDFGATWNAMTLPLASNWQDISWNNSLFCLVTASNGNVYTSPTGLTGTWTAHASGIASIASIATAS